MKANHIQAFTNWCARVIKTQINNKYYNNGILILLQIFCETYNGTTMMYIHVYHGMPDPIQPFAKEI